MVLLALSFGSGMEGEEFRCSSAIVARRRRCRPKADVREWRGESATHEMDGVDGVRQVERVRQVSRHALVTYSPTQMFALVDDVESYPQFLPWCRSAQVIERSTHEVIARLQVHKGPLHTHFTTRNELESPSRIVLNLVEGPFRTLEGEWRFSAIADQGTRVSLTLKFAFANPINA